MHLIKKDLEKTIHTFLQLSKPCLAIMEGAVLFGINPNIISSRIVRYTIGTNARLLWNKKKYSKNGRKVFDEVNKKWVWKDCFSKYIEINEKIKLGKEITQCISSYRFEEGVEEIGKGTLAAKKDYRPSERSINIIMKFGGTFIDVKAKLLKRGEEIKTTLNLINFYNCTKMKIEFNLLYYLIIIYYNHFLAWNIHNLPDNIYLTIF